MNKQIKEWPAWPTFSFCTFPSWRILPTRPHLSRCFWNCEAPVFHPLTADISSLLSPITTATIVPSLQTSYSHLYRHHSPTTWIPISDLKPCSDESKLKIVSVVLRQEQFPSPISQNICHHVGTVFTITPEIRWQMWTAPGLSYLDQGCKALMTQHQFPQQSVIQLTEVAPQGSSIPLPSFKQGPALPLTDACHGLRSVPSPGHSGCSSFHRRVFNHN